MPQVVFHFALESDLLPLTGTSSEEHMAEDLAAFDVELTPADMRLIATLGAAQPQRPTE